MMAVRELAHRKRVVDLGRRVVVDRECPRVRRRKLGQRRQRSPGGELDALGKGLREKRVVVVVVRGRNCAALREQRDRVRLQRSARRGERLPFERVLVGAIEQHRQLRAERVRQPMRAQFVLPLRHLSALAQLAVDRGKRGLESLGRRLAVASFAALVEIHRRAGQRERDGGGFRRRGRAAVILPGKVREAEFVVGRHFPQEIRVELTRELLRLGIERRRRRIGEAEQHRRGLDLEPLAGDGLDLERRFVVGKDGAGLQLAVILEKDVHGAR